MNEENSNLRVNRHSFYRMIDVHSENEDQDYDDVFAYMYEFHTGQLPRIGDIQELLGDPDEMYINRGIREIEYAYGEYSLNFIIDDHGNVRNVYYYHEF